MRALLDGNKVETRQMLHRALQEILRLPAWYGQNLDALHDCLTERQEQTELTVIHAAALRARLGSYADAFCRVLHDSAQENEAFTVLWEE